MAAPSPALAVSANSPLLPDIVIPASHWSRTPGASPSKRRKGKGRADDRRESVLSERDANEGQLVDVQSASGLTPSTNKTLYPPRTPSAFALSLLDKSPSLLKAQLSTPLIPLGTPVTVRKKLDLTNARKENETPSTRRGARRAGPNSPSPAGLAAFSPEKNASSSPPRTVRYSPSPRRLRSSPRKHAQTPPMTSSAPLTSPSPTPAPTVVTPSSVIHRLDLAHTSLSAPHFPHFSLSTPQIRTHASYRDEELTDCDADGSYWDADEDVSLSWSYGPTGSADSTAVVEEYEAHEVDQEMAVAVGGLSLDAASVEGGDVERDDNSADLAPTEVEDNDEEVGFVDEDAESVTSDQEVDVAAVVYVEGPGGPQEELLSEVASSPDVQTAEAVEQANIAEADALPTAVAIVHAVGVADPSERTDEDAIARATTVDEHAALVLEAVEKSAPAEGMPHDTATVADEPTVAAVDPGGDEPVDDVDRDSGEEEAAPPTFQQEVVFEEALVHSSPPSPSCPEPVSLGDEAGQAAQAINAFDGIERVADPADLKEPIVHDSQASRTESCRQDQVERTRTRVGGDGLAIAGDVSLGGAEAGWRGYDDEPDARPRQPVSEAGGGSPAVIRLILVNMFHTVEQLERISATLSGCGPTWSALDRNTRDKLVDSERAFRHSPPGSFASTTRCASRHYNTTYDHSFSSPLPATHRFALCGSSNARVSPRSFRTSLSLDKADRCASFEIDCAHSNVFRTACPPRPRVDYSPFVRLVRLEYGSPSNRRSRTSRRPRSAKSGRSFIDAVAQPVRGFSIKTASREDCRRQARSSADASSATYTDACCATSRRNTLFPSQMCDSDTTRYCPFHLSACAVNFTISVSRLSSSTGYPPTSSAENLAPAVLSTALLAPAEKLATTESIAIFEPSARPAPVRATRRTRLAEIQPTVPPTTHAPDEVPETPATLRSSRRTIASTVAPAPPDEASTEPLAVQPKTPILRTRRSRLRLLTEEAAAAAAAELSAEPAHVAELPLPATVEDAQPAVTCPLPSFRPAPAVTQDELNRLTQRNTKKNQVAFNRIKLETVFIDCARPPSPTSKIRKAFGSEGSLGRTTTKEGREARAAKRRNALRSSLDGSELAAFAEELEAESGSSVQGGSLKHHFRAAGDDEQYFTPQKAGGALQSVAAGRKRSPGSGSSSASASPRRQGPKRVKWDRALVYEGPLDRDAASKGQGIIKPVDLDAWGNSTSIASLGKPTSITIRMRVFKDEQ
ncbi:hypothetical protein Rt10032_c08g3732 [Rhodotorula toruloides]|uniref:Uncharacterized protein n=1 Tax=Rhodotorula toruloides TaxID=5286 RepID=A0A511KID7_RHOTO|nr:hypothetical protein Rt10032_c08g3732 [Rhodotorula toruloides]